MFKPSAEKIQQDMFETELQRNSGQSAMEYDAKTGDQEMVELQRRRENEDLTRWQQDLHKELELVTYKLRRMFLDDDKDIWKSLPGEPTGNKENGEMTYHPMKPMMNEKGINYFITSAIPSLSRNLMMSNFNEERIYTRLKRIVLKFIYHLGYYYKEYEIDQGDLSAIVSIFKDVIEPAHWRCLNNGERSYLNTINKRVEAYTYGQPQQKPKGFLSGLLG